MEALSENFSPEKIVIQEKYADVFKEAIPLIKAHSEEVGLNRLPHPWRAPFDMYRKVEEHGDLIWLSVRDDTLALVGYAMYLICPSPLFSGKLHAVLDWIYIQPPHRSVALLKQLWQEGDRLLRERGVTSLSWSMWTKPGGDHPMQSTKWRFLE